jgi:hypothetical protein
VHKDVIKSLVKPYPSLTRAKRDLRSLECTLFSHPGTPENKPFIFSPKGQWNEDKDMLHSYLVFFSGGLNPGFEPACTIRANARQLAKTLAPKSGPDGTYFLAKVDVGITFGDTELKAFIQWEENVRTPGIAPPVYSICWCA